MTSILTLGFRSGISTAIGLFPHLIFLIFIFLMGHPSPPLVFLVGFTIVAKVFGEWLFWHINSDRMDSDPKLKNWRSEMNLALFKHPNAAVSLSLIFADNVTEIMIIVLALKCSLSPLLVFITLFGTQILGAPIQGLFSDMLNMKNALFFAMFVQYGVVFVLNGLAPEGNFVEIPEMLFQGLGMSNFSLQTKILFLICLKGLFGNLTTLSRAAIAHVLSLKVSKVNR